MASSHRHSVSARWAAWVWPLGAVAAVAVLQLAGLLGPLERALGDARFQILQRPASDRLVVVAIDPPSLQALDVWPWPRRYHAQVVDRLFEAGARAVAVDIDFSSPSNPDDDALLEGAFARAEGRVLLPLFRQPVESPQGIRWAYNAPLERFAPYVGGASVNAWPDADGLVRQLPLRDHWPGGAVPSLSAVLAERLYGRSLEAGDDRYRVDFSIDPDTIPQLSFVDVLEGRFAPADVAGRTVLIGATAAELRDDLPVPVHRTLAGVRLHALGVNAIVDGRALQPVPAPILLALGLAIALLYARYAGRWSWQQALAATAAGALGLFLAACALQAAAPYLLEAAPHMVLLALLFAGALVGRIDRQSLDLLVQSLRLRHLNVFMHNVVENSFDGILTVEPDGRIRTANTAAARILAIDGEALVGRDAKGLIPELFAPAGAGGGRMLLGQRETFGLRGGRDRFPLEVGLTALDASGQTYYVAILRDITERQRQRALLEHQALHDSLTGLPNRNLLADRLGHAVAQARREAAPMALLLLDLDRFKAVNDTLGHQIGDRLLCHVAERLVGPLREVDTIARLGGDEFALILPAIESEESAGAVAARLLETLGAPFSVDGLSLEIGASIGIALFPEHAEEGPRLLQCADVAMYQAKQAGGGVAVYDEDRDHNSVRHLTITGELRKAIETRQLSFHYQPKIDLASGRVVGAEALIRWQHPELGFVPPDEFIVLAEQTGLIEALTAWSFDQTLAQAARWRALGLELGIAVNLSARTLHDEGLPDMVAAALSRHRVAPGLLTVEITETAIMLDPERAARVVGRLHDLGLRLSVDDFGTGHSSLAYLKRLPLDELKIDRTFVMQMTENDDDAVIVRSTVDLSHSLGLKVVAEGVELEEHLQILRGLACDTAQGYFISRPLTPEAFEDWCRAQGALPSRPTSAPALALDGVLATA